MGNKRISIGKAVHLKFAAAHPRENSGGKRLVRPI
jgi:hypothetical protein